VFCRLQEHHKTPQDTDDIHLACAMKNLRQGLSLAKIKVLCYLLLLLLLLLVLLQSSMIVFSAPPSS